MKKLLAVAQKEFRQIARDPLTLGMLLGVPALMLLLYGYALNFDVRHVGLAVQDMDLSSSSRSLVSSFVNSTYFDKVGSVPAGADLRRLTQRRRARAVLVIPDGFGRDLAAGRRASVQLILDGTDSNTAAAILSYARVITNQANMELTRHGPGGDGGMRAAGMRAAITYRPRVWFNPELNSTHFLVPGLIGFILMITAVVSTALSVVREKERGTMEQLMVTPLRAPQLLLGKTLPYLLISLVAAAVILATARGLFQVVVKGPYFDLFLATLIYLVGALGLGLLISSMADTQAMAFQLGATLSMLPALFLSGFIFPLRSMPAVLQAISYVVPARYYLVILRGIILKGAGLAAFPEQLTFLLLYATATMALAWVRLNRGGANL
jgi:ABC-2 type transport system permease protein